MFCSPLVSSQLFCHMPSKPTSVVAGEPIRVGLLVAGSRSRKPADSNTTARVSVHSKLYLVRANSSCP